MFKNQSRVLLVLLLIFKAAACGNSESPATPTPQSARGTSTLSGPIAARSSFCRGFNNARAGAVSASVLPRSLRVILVAGSCDAPGQTLAEGDGDVVNVEAPAGSNHVRLSNQSDVALSFSLTITHWF